MAILDTRIFTGTDEHDAAAQLQAALADGSFPVEPTSPMWMSHLDVTPGAMQSGYHRLYVTAWVTTAPHDPVQALVEAIHDERR